MQTQTIHHQQGKFRPIQPEPATQVVNKPATNSSKQRHFQTEKNRARAAYKQLPDRESNNKQSIVKPVETTEIPVAYQQHIQEKQDIHMAEIT
jgi:FixJ family two-component response regulator